MSELTTDRLRATATGSDYLFSNARNELLRSSADLIDQQALVIRELVEVLTEADANVHWKFDARMSSEFQGRVKSVLARAAIAKALP